MPIVPAIRPTIKKTNLQPIPDEMPEFDVSISVNHHTKVRANSEEEASDIAWEEILNQGAWDQDIMEVPDGAS